MKRTLLLWCFAASALLTTAALGEPAAGEKILSGPAASSQLELRGVHAGSDGSITGTVVNGTRLVIKDVELLLTHAWSWNNEMHPGEDNRGRAGFVRMTGEIPPKGSLAFSYAPSPALPKRADVTFETTVAVHSFSEIGD